MTGALRTVLAVLLATALLGAAAPAADRAREERTATRLVAETDDLATAARTLATRDGGARGRRGSPGARRFVTLHVPDGGAVVVRDPTTRNGTRARSALAWRVDGGPWHDRPPDGAGPPESVVVRPAGDALHFGPGQHRLRLSLVPGDPRPVVRVGRAEPPGD